MDLQIQLIHQHQHYHSHYQEIEFNQHVKKIDKQIIKVIIVAVNLPEDYILTHQQEDKWMNLIMKLMQLEICKIIFLFLSLII